MRRGIDEPCAIGHGEVGIGIFHLDDMIARTVKLAQVGLCLQRIAIVGEGLLLPVQKDAGRSEGAGQSQTIVSLGGHLRIAALAC